MVKEKQYAWKRLSDGAIVQASYPSKDELFEAAGFGAVDVDKPIKGYVAVEVQCAANGNLVEAVAAPLASIDSQ